MKGFIGILGFMLLLGGAGSSDCGAALLPSVGISMVGLALIFLAMRIGGKRC